MINYKTHPLTLSLRRLWQESGLTQREFAQKTGITYVSMLRYLNGQTLIPSDKLESVAVATGTVNAYFRAPDKFGEKRPSFLQLENWMASNGWRWKEGASPSLEKNGIMNYLPAFNNSPNNAVYDSSVRANILALSYIHGIPVEQILREIGL